MATITPAKESRERARALIAAKADELRAIENLLATALDQRAELERLVTGLADTLSELQAKGYSRNELVAQLELTPAQTKLVFARRKKAGMASETHTEASEHRTHDTVVE